MIRRRGPRSRRIRRGIAFAAALLQTVALGAANGGETSREQPGAPAEQAADLFRQGLSAYDAHRYRSAIDIFSRVYEQTHASALLFNIAQAWRLLGDCPRAVAQYDAFVVADPASPDVDRARDWLGKLRPCHDADVAATEEPETAKAVSAPSKVTPSERAQYPALGLRASDAAPPPVAGPYGQPVLEGVLGGASIAFAGTGFYAAWRANDIAKQLTASYGNGGTWNRQAVAVQREGERAQTEAIVLFSATVLSGLAAYLVYRFGGRPVSSFSSP